MMGTLLRSQSLVIDVHGTPVFFEDMEIHSGDFALIKGPNGYGKSSFLKMLVGRDIRVQPIKGSLIFPYLDEKKSMTVYSDEEKGRLHNSIAYVAQEDDFFPTSSIFSAIYTNLKFSIAHNRNLNAQEKAEKRKQCKEMVNQYLAKFNDSGLFDDQEKKSLFKSPHLRSIYSCSGGQRKMCQIVTALIKAKLLGTKIILMDEPLNNLDKNNKKILNNELKELLQMENSPAILMVTHCHIFFGVNKEIALMDGESGRIAKIYSEGRDALFSSCLIEGNEKDGFYKIETKKDKSN